ncbi:hypothetical protein [Cellulosimicrobium cellulans]|uniref:hypothetical protein n=1 Tax=Cellulosimicrobium cellulans TaxID=1710 RepID=UPI001BA9371D|nr:hypothetical protein [Cellulosimicrobium cellulans]QUC01104.1 hypothetical protein J5A69_08020 [Cellulosimicrobium cellulans]
MATNVRTWLLAQFRSALGTGWQLTPYDEELTPSRKTVMFFRSSVVPSPEAPGSGYLDNTVTLYVATAKQVGPKALDGLDAALDDVIVALHGIHNAVFVSATYKVLGETVPAFEVQVTVTSNITSTES